MLPPSPSVAGRGDSKLLSGHFPSFSILVARSELNLPSVQIGLLHSFCAESVCPSPARACASLIPFSKISPLSQSEVYPCCPAPPPSTVPGLVFSLPLLLTTMTPLLCQVCRCNSPLLQDEATASVSYHTSSWAAVSFSRLSKFMRSKGKLRPSLITYTPFSLCFYLLMDFSCPQPDHVPGVE